MILYESRLPIMTFRPIDPSGCCHKKIQKANFFELATGVGESHASAKPEAQFIGLSSSHFNLEFLEILSPGRRSHCSLCCDCCDLGSISNQLRPHVLSRKAGPYVQSAAKIGKVGVWEILKYRHSLNFVSFRTQYRVDNSRFPRVGPRATSLRPYVSKE